MTPLGVAHRQAEIEVWGTVVFVDVASQRASDAELDIGIDRVREFVSHVDEVFSTFKPESVISQLRRSEIEIDDCSDEVREVWNRCGFARDISLGAFDPWAVAGGFDPSGLVKGWAADRCCQILQANGAEHIQINAAGDLSLRGGNLVDGEVIPWVIGVVNPENTEEIVQVFTIMDGAIATSGAYERGAHIVDPHTRLIAIGAKSATVIGPDGAFADAIATALMVDGRDGASWFTNPELSDYSVWVIDRDENVAWSLGSQAPTL